MHKTETIDEVSTRVREPGGCYQGFNAKASFDTGKTFEAGNVL